MKRSEKRNVLLEYSPSGHQFHYNIHGKNLPSVSYHNLGWGTLEEVSTFCETVQPFVTKNHADDKEISMETVREAWKHYCGALCSLYEQGKATIPVLDETMDGIDESTILVTDDGEFYFLCAGPTFKRVNVFEHPDSGQTEDVPADYVKARVCYVASKKRAYIDEYVFPLTGPMAIKYHKASEYERNYFISYVMNKDLL